MPLLEFGDWLPDLPNAGHPALTDARNVVPAAKGYRAMRAPLAIGGQISPDRVRGALAARDNAGATLAVGGTGGTGGTSGTAQLWLQRTAGGFTTASTTGGYTSMSLETDAWDFAQWGDFVLATNYLDYPQVLAQGASLFDQLGTSAGAGANIPKARRIAVVRDFVFLANLNDDCNTSDGVVPQRIAWSPINDPDTDWPDWGTDAAAAVLSDYQDLPGEGGHCQDVVAVSEIALVFQERMIWRVDFVGAGPIWSLSRVDSDRGLLAPSACAAHGTQAYFMADDGFFRCDGANVYPIGRERVDRFVYDQLDFANRHRISSAIDPRHHVAAWAIPVTGNAGQPTLIMLYDWLLERWSYVVASVDVLTRALPPSEDLDSASFNAHGDIDNAYWNSSGGHPWDSVEFLGYPWVLGGFDDSGRIFAFAGSAMDATIETGDWELTPGGFSLVRSVRPIVEGRPAGSAVAMPKVSVATRPRIGVDPAYSTPRGVDATGKVNVRRSGRYHRARVTFAGESYDKVDVHGLDVDFEPQGLR